jgi:hypothetical protein
LDTDTDAKEASDLTEASFVTYTGCAGNCNPVPV